MNKEEKHNYDQIRALIRDELCALVVEMGDRSDAEVIRKYRNYLIANLTGRIWDWFEHS